jgi:Mor family transcriptional regulator
MFRRLESVSVILTTETDPSPLNVVFQLTTTMNVKKFYHFNNTSLSQTFRNNKLFE